MIGPLKNKIHRIAPELQFWGYESGNVLAAVAGAGGFASFYGGVRSIGDMPGHNPVTAISTTFSVYPDIAVTIGLAIIVLFTIIFGVFLDCSKNIKAKYWIDGTASVFGICLVGAALSFGASWITFAAVSFVSASALLRLCRSSPVFLKLGGLLLAAGGVGLAAYGLSSIQVSQPLLLPSLTFLTGLYVISASLMTYQGGIFACNEHERTELSENSRSRLFQYDGPVARVLVARLDGPVTTLVNRVALPSVFWVSTKTKENTPFLTSMWTRLPWRLFTACAAMATGTTAGILFSIANVLWAIGDVAIGALDWEEKTQ